MSHAASSSDPNVARRQSVMAICAHAKQDELAAIVSAFGATLTVHDLRPPETGLVMLRGRMGGDGAPFNVGEATVTRASVALDGRQTGFAYHLGRDVAKARAAAIIDALWQRADRRDDVEAALTPVRARIAAEDALRARQTAATRVDFFTLVRGED